MSIKIGAISLGRSTKKYTHDMSFDNNTTMGFGFMQPLCSQLMYKGDKINLSAKQLVRLAPMPVPSFARIKAVNRAFFVPMTDVFPAWDALLAHQPVSTTVYSYIPEKLPRISNRFLATWLIGCYGYYGLFAQTSTVGVGGQSNQIQRYPQHVQAFKVTQKIMEIVGEPQGVTSTGFYFVMVMGMFDFSIGANIMLSAIVGCVLATKFNLGYFGLIVGGILTGTIVGLLNGIFYVKLRIPSMIVTTGLALIYESLANYMAGGVEQTLPAHLRAFGRMPWDIILALVACVVAYIFLNYTKIGTYTYAIGSDEFVAKNMGINVNKYKVLAFILSGAFLGVMAILTISYGSSMVAVTGMASMSRNFVPTMGCFFGLAFKKYGMPLQAIIIGEFVINIIFFGFIALGAPTAIQDVITGFALLIIVTLTTKVTKGEIVK